MACKLRRFPLLVSLLLLFSAGLVAAEGRPNFVIILADDLGYGDLSTYGGWIEVPHLDRMAAEGLRFTDFHSNGAVCSPTRAALVTGRYQQRAGIPGVVFADPRRPEHEDGLQPVEVTFAELLSEHGYATAIFGKWHLGYLPRYNPLRHGFQLFRGYVSGNVDYFSHVDQAGAHDWWHNDKNIVEEGYSTHLITRHALEFIESHAREPFCVYVAHEAPHYPYQTPDDDPRGFRRPGEPSVRQKLDEAEIRRRYRVMVEEMDASTGRILALLRRLGLERRTLVFFFSDNGATPRGSNRPLRGHKGTVWEGGHRVPAIAWWPGKIRPGQVTDQLAAGFDLMPTMLELAGVAAPKERPLDGVSLAPLLLEGREIERGPLFWSTGRALAMREGPWKLVLGERDAKKPALFHLGEDLGEANDLAARYPERTRKMTQTARRWLEEVQATATPQPSQKKRRARR